ncbi:glycosyltransferase family 4 protein [Anoxybacillus rupiensis]|jgi:glycosyltransferase involved in cell wall biosynthesis|uniref:glycosyltransferase family 4 protein n=1 Tax=Anoxybacteroides rupiense TaxID=311460 RepID=UPI001BAAB834|nr:glycosyltransferase family 4 protein [Anoxybacillus rupiensis]MBS2770458.1 glycosyltransferase family 4 protein [Anoxybacillus rupiensis]
MNIAYICTEKLPSPAIKGGAIQLMIDGIAPFISQTNKLTIFSITDPLLPVRECRNGIEYIRFPKETYEHDVAAELAKHSFDVIHVFNRPAHMAKYKEAAKQSSFVLSLHNDMFSPLKLCKEKAEQALQSSTLITAVSEYIKQTVIRRYHVPEQKIRVAYSGVDLEKYVPIWTEEGERIRRQLRQTFGIDDQKVIVFIGRLSKTKGPHLLIQCMPDLLLRHPDARLVIVGGKWFSENTWDDYVSMLHRLSAPLKNHIIFTNYIPSEQIPRMFLIGDVFVCSSQWHEPLARVHYEAMAAGIPIITTNRGGNPEIIRHLENGFVINHYHDATAFSKAIDYMFTHPEKAQEMARIGREEVERQFQFRHVAQRFAAIYEEAFTNHCLH